MSAVEVPDPAQALMAMYEDAVADVYGYLVRRCPRSAAEDVTAETFLAAVAAIERGAVHEVTAAWLVGIARHKLVDHWRRLERDERRRRAAATLAEPIEDPWDAVLDRARAHDVLAQLGADHRAALSLRYLDGLTTREVSDVLGRSPAGVEALVTRAKAAFRELYEERDR